MRTDLPLEFTQKMTSKSREPFQLAVFRFPNAGNIYVVDRADLVIPDMPEGTLLQAIVEDWGTMSDSGDQEEVTSETVETTLSLLNTGGIRPFSDYFLYDDPENVKVDLYQSFVGLSWNDKVLIDTYVAQDPIHLEQNTLIVSVDIVSANMLYDGPIGDVLTTDRYPYALPSDVGKGIDLIVGAPGEMNTLCSVKTRECTLKGQILPYSLTIDTNEDLFELKFPNFGRLFIDNEIIRYSSITQFAFIVRDKYDRGMDWSDAAEHTHNSAIFEMGRHEFIVGELPLASIADVKVDGFVPDNNFTVFPNNIPPTIEFEDRPTYLKAAASATSTEFKPNNDKWSTCQTPYQAYDDKNNTGAVIHSTNSYYDIGRTLSIEKHEAGVLALGPIVSAQLVVKQWPYFYYLNDSAKVYFDGAYLGELTKPNKHETISFNEFIDLTHDHDHESSIDHSHGSADPGYVSEQYPHDHTFDSTPTASHTSSVFYTYNIGNNSYIHSPYIYASYDDRTVILDRRYTYKGYLTFLYPSTPPSGFSSSDIVSTTYTISFFLAGVNSVKFDGHTYYGGGTVTFTNNNGGDSFVRVEVEDTNVMGSTYVKITAATATYNYSGGSSIVKTDPDIYTSRSQGGTIYEKVWDRNAPDPDTVLDHEGDFTLDLSKAGSGKTYDDKFDLTDDTNTVELMDFFNKEIKIVYTGSTENSLINIQEVSIVVQHRVSERHYSFDVTCSAVAAEDNRPDKVIQLLLERAGMDVSQMGSVDVELDDWIDSETWNDVAYWQDGGQTTDVPNTPFDLAAQKYDALGYRLDGIISATDQLKDVLKNILIQSRSRLIWSAGMAKLTLQRRPISWINSDYIPNNAIQLNSITYKRQNIVDIANKINIEYGKDYISDEFVKLKQLTDSKSINKHGVREKTYSFDMVKDTVMIDSVSNFYLNQHANPSTFYEITTYLSSFAVEKTDVLNITAPLTGMHGGERMQVMGIERTYGNSKSNQINTLKFLCEVYNKRFILLPLTDSFTLNDSSMLVMDDLDLTTTFTMVDDYTAFTINAYLEDSVSVAESFNPEYTFSKEFSDKVTLEEAMGIAFLIELSTTFTLIENTLFWQDTGFALGGFSSLTFGGKTPLNGIQSSTFGLAEEVTITLTKG